MEKSLFYHILENPNLLTPAIGKELEKLYTDFPNFTPAAFLFLRSLKNQESVYFDKELKKTAFGTHNRFKLNHFLHTKFEPNNSESSKTLDEFKQEQSFNPDEVESINLNYKPNNSSIKTDELDTEILNHAIHSSISIEVPYILEDTEDDDETIESSDSQSEIVVQTKPKNFYDWLESTTSKESHKNNNSSDNKQISQKKKESIINKFIQEEPKISVKKDFYSPVNMAKKSVVDDSNLVSETLAKIYADQGDYSNAIKAYEKLSLNYPEKSIYFADRIKAIKEKRKNS